MPRHARQVIGNRLVELDFALVLQIMTPTAVNCLLIEAMRNLVSGLFGTSSSMLARLAFGKQRLPSRATRTDPPNGPTLRASIPDAFGNQLRCIRRRRRNKSLGYSGKQRHEK